MKIRTWVSCCISGIESSS